MEANGFHDASAGLEESVAAPAADRPAAMVERRVTRKRNILRAGGS